MKEDKILRKSGITVLKAFSILEVNKIAKIISDKICASFPEHNINKSDLFLALSKVHMYLADFSDSSAAKYYYKTDSIYFRKDINFENLESLALHECLHFIQVVRNDNGSLNRMGLYEINMLKDTGLVLNEAAVQLMASRATNVKKDSVKYYGLEFSSQSPNYYPIECNIVQQMAYFTGTYPLYHSTIYSDDIFKNTFVMKSDLQTYNKIAHNLDLLSEYQDALEKENLYLSYIEYDKIASQKIEKSKKRIETLKNDIKYLTLKTQELILTKCSYSDFDLIRTTQDVKDFKNRLYNFKKYLITSENYTFYNDFYCDMMEQLDIKRELIQKYGALESFKEIPENLSLIETRKEKLNLFKVAVEKLKKLFKINQETTVSSQDFNK